MALVLAGQVAGLRGLTAALEDALSSSLCSCNPLTEEAFVAFQRIDFMRQSLKDIESLLTRFGPNLRWESENEITQTAFSSVVDMGGSIDPLFKKHASEKATGEDDSGDLDLW